MLREGRGSVFSGSGQFPKPSPGNGSKARRGTVCRAIWFGPVRRRESAHFRKIVPKEMLRRLACPLRPAAAEPEHGANMLAQD
jgi:hypothetical protein